jgi:poly(glycerol-phosphate) alpha-glucosyltransferase
MPDVVFLGPVYGSVKSSAYFHADAFILPSQCEALPMVVLEAWAAGAIVLMTELCNLTEGFSANAAIRVEAETGSIRQGLARLAAMTPEERLAAGERGREIVKSRYSWKIAATEIDRVYDWLLATGARPGSVTCA